MIDGRSSFISGGFDKWASVEKRCGDFGFARVYIYSFPHRRRFRILDPTISDKEILKVGPPPPPPPPHGFAHLRFSPRVESIPRGKRLFGLRNVRKYFEIVAISDLRPYHHTICGRMAISVSRSSDPRCSSRDATLIFTPFYWAPRRFPRAALHSVSAYRCPLYGFSSRADRFCAFIRRAAERIRGVVVSVIVKE